jgi:hypothetical protein
MKTWRCGLLFAMLILPEETHATTQMSWADKFISGWAACANNDCEVAPEFASSNSIQPARWQLVGKQGSTSTGRAAAREQVNLHFRDDSVTGCSTQTVQVARYRTTSPPAEGSSCSATVTYVTASSVTLDSCQFANADVYYWNGNSPTLDFSAETVTSGTVGYKSVDTTTNSLGSGSSGVGCFTILWQ